MKKLLAICSFALAMNTYAQSYLVLNNGVTLTVDNLAFVYDFGHFIPPYKVTLTGGQYLVEDEKLVTVDVNGFLYRKEEKAPKKLKGKGLNYLISDSGTLITVDKSGFYFKFDKDSALKKSVGYGGNFFTVKPDDKKPQVDLYTVNSTGNYFKMSVQDLNPANITVFGGSFFMTSTGLIYTVSTSGFVFPKADIKTGPIKKSGGNYFITEAGLLYTVSEDGFLMLPILPANINVSGITKFGSNYLLDNEGRIFVVDKTGAIFERSVKDHDLRNSKLFSL